MQKLIGGIFTGSLSAATWKTATYEQRQQMIREIVAKINTIQGTKVTNIEFYNQGPQNGMMSNGYYRDSDRSIHINLYRQQDFEGILTTVVHELRHAYQHEVTRNPEQFIVTEETAQSWARNFKNYITAERSYNAYRSQPVEQDARDFSEGVNYL